MGALLFSLHWLVLVVGVAGVCLHFASDSFFVSSPAPEPGRPGPRPRLQSSALLGSHLQQRCGRKGWEWSRLSVSTAPVPRAAGQPEGHKGG